MNLKELKEIFRLVEKTDFTEVEIVRRDSRVRIERGKTMTQSSFPFMPAQEASVGVISTPTSSTKPEKSGTKHFDEAVASSEKDFFVTSPFVGTFYRAPSPDAESYVEINQVVHKGQVLCIVEAMKLMNEIESDYEGKIVEIYPENGKPVEFGEKLFRIQRIS